MSESNDGNDVYEHEKNIELCLSLAQQEWQHQDQLNDKTDNKAQIFVAISGVLIAGLFALIGEGTFGGKGSEIVRILITLSILSSGFLLLIAIILSCFTIHLRKFRATTNLLEFLEWAKGQNLADTQETLLDNYSSSYKYNRVVLERKQNILAYVPWIIVSALIPLSVAALLTILAQQGV